MKAFLLCVAVILVCDCTNGLFLPSKEGRLRNTAPSISWFSRVRRLSRPTHRIIDPSEDCFLVTSEEGELFYKSPSDESVVCGIYMIAEPGKRIEVIFNYLDVPCDNGGLVAWVDGWELNGQVWPADAWDEDRLVESCNQRPLKKLVSRQNAALIQYRVPSQGKGFAVTIRHLRNARPCNVMLFGAEGVYTLRNHGETGNCSVLAVSPATVHVLDLNVGQSVKREEGFETETGTIHHGRRWPLPDYRRSTFKILVVATAQGHHLDMDLDLFCTARGEESDRNTPCTKRGLPDYVDIGGAGGLDHTKMEVLDNICGLDSNEARRPLFIACEDSVVRLVSSGRYHNSVTLAFAPLPMDELVHTDLLCGMNDMLIEK